MSTTAPYIPSAAVAGGHPPTTTAVHALMRFGWLLRRRKPAVLLALAIALALGGLYYATAPRIFRATAQVLLRHSQPDPQNVTLSADRSTQDQMATFQRLFVSAEILGGALDRLEGLPPEIEADATREKAIQELKDLVSAYTLRGTSIIEVSCESQQPDAAKQIVDALVTSYVAYIDDNHRSFAAEVLTTLKQQEREHQSRLDASERKLLAAKQQSADFGLDDKNGVVHPMIQNVIALNTNLAETREHRTQIESSLSAVRDAITSGGDLRQHLLALEPVVGKQLVMDALGISPQDLDAVHAAEKEILELESKLQALRVHLLDNHPKVFESVQRIESLRQYVAAFETRRQERQSGSENYRLGPLLVNLLEEDLARTWKQERELQQQFLVAEQRALELSNQMAQVQMLEREVKSQRAFHAGLIDKIKSIDINQHYGDVHASIVTAPTLPEDPVSPLLARVVLLCVVLGLGTGTLVVYVLDVLDDRFRSPEELQEQLGVAVLAMVRRHEAYAGQGLEALQVYRAPNAVESEAFRTLRTTMAFSGSDCQRVVITSAEPADGKTTVLANLGISYALAGRRTLLVDCDLRRPGLTNLFQWKGQEGVSEILRGRGEVAAMCRGSIRRTGLDGLDVLPAGRRPADSAELLGRDRFAELIAWAEQEYDQILVDSPPVLAAADAAIAARQLDGVIVVVQPQKNHRRSVVRAFEGLRALSVHVMGTVINAVSDQDGHDYYGYGQGYGYGYGDTAEPEEDNLEPTVAFPQPADRRPAASRQEPTDLSPGPRPIGPRTDSMDSADQDIEESLKRLARWSKRAA